MGSCQRWRRRRDAWRPAGETFDPRAYGVELLADGPARDFVVAHHYSGSFPASRLRVGLFRRRELVGVAVFSVPMTGAVIRRWTGLEPAAGVELGRLVLLDDVPGNGESWFVARAFRVLAGELPDVRAVVSFSDPVARIGTDGRVVTPGHVGIVYQALNGLHLGRSRPRWLTLARDGRVVSERTLSKLRTDDRGAAYAYRQLVDCGAPARLPGEESAAYVARALREGPFRRVRHPGNLAYVWGVGRCAAHTAKSWPCSLPYPKPSTHLVAALECP